MIRFWLALSKKSKKTPEYEIEFLGPQTIFMLSTTIITKYSEVKEFHWWLGGAGVFPRVAVAPRAPPPTPALHPSPDCFGANPKCFEKWT